MLVERTFDKLATVRRPSEVSDDMGGRAVTWPAVLTDVPCRLDPSTLSPREDLVGGQLASRMTWTVTLPRGTDVRATDRLEIEGRTFEVVAPRGPRSHEIARVVVVAEIR